MRAIFPENDTGKLQKARLDHDNNRRSDKYAENEQKAQTGMAVLFKSEEPHDLQSALP